MPRRIAIRTLPTIGCQGLAFRQDGLAGRAAVTSVWVAAGEPIAAHSLRHGRRPA